MNILLVDNGTIRLTELLKLLNDHVITTVSLGKIDSVSINGFDLIILSGSSKYPVAGNEKFYQQEIELIKKTSVPIIGICLGFELIGYTFGAKLEKLDKKEKGIIEINITDKNRIFKQLPNFKVYEAHRWVIKQLSDNLIELASSADGVEAFKHKDKEIYGFQFHPEVFVEKTCGDEIFNNTIKAISQHRDIL